MSHYRHHVFICTNQRDGGRKCCGADQAGDMLEFAKDRVKELKLAGPGKARVNASGCMNRCAKGPIIAIYPEAVWYTYANQDDVEEIIATHLAKGEIVERLLVPERRPGDPDKA